MSRVTHEAIADTVDERDPDALGQLGEQFRKTLPEDIAKSIGDPKKWLATAFHGYKIESVKHFIAYNKERFMRHFLKPSAHMMKGTPS